jgi:hypothetical protein
MARQIKETPILIGKDAKRFIALKKQTEGKKEDPKIKERIMKNHQKFKIVI